MIVKDVSTRKIRIEYSHSEIVDLLIKDIREKQDYNFHRSNLDIKFTHLEEGSPAYKTDKIKCVIIEETTDEPKTEAK